MRARTNISNLGLVASHKRTIKSGAEYEKYFDTTQVQGEEVVLNPDGTVYDTLKLMQKVVKQTLPQTKKIAQALKGSTTEETCRNIWNFLYTNIQYKKDNPLREQIRTPLRSWKDRKIGIDCDCYAVFAASILTNLGMPNAFRMAAYKKDFQHVYVVVKTASKTIVIDPVLDSFNHEAPFTKKHDHTMSKITMLNGVDGDACNTKPIVDRLRRYMSTEQVREMGYVPTQEFLEQNNIPYVQVINEETEGGMFQINTPYGTHDIKTILTQAEAKEVLNSLVAPSSLPASTMPITTAALVSDMDKAKAAMKKLPWWLIAGTVVCGVILLTGKEDRPEPKALDGIPKNILVKKRTKQKQKLRTMYA